MRYNFSDKLLSGYFLSSLLMSLTGAGDHFIEFINERVNLKLKQILLSIRKMLIRRTNHCSLKARESLCKLFISKQNKKKIEIK